MKENESKRQHWGESVKGRVSSDYKGLTDAELERRFPATSNAKASIRSAFLHTSSGLRSRVKGGKGGALARRSS